MTAIITIQQAVYPLFIICSVCGLGIYSQKKLHLNILYNLTIWTSYGCLCYYVVTSCKAEIWFHSISNMVHVRIGVLSTITSLITSVYQDKKFRLFWKRLAAVDDTLEELGTPKIYQKLHAYTKRVLIGWLMCSYIGNTFDMIWWLYAMEDNRCIVIPHITNHYHHINMLIDFILTTILWYIGTRFDEINEHMKYLMPKEKHGLRDLWRYTHRYTIHTDHKRVLWTSMHLHLELRQIARELNTIFGPHMTIEMAAYLVYVARMCEIIFMHIRTKGRYVRTPVFWVGMSFWISMYLARLFSLNYICEKVSSKASKMEKLIHRLTDSLQYADVRTEIYQFSLQIIHHPLKFTGLGLFYFGNRLLQKFVITIAAFVIIIIQISDKTETKTEEDF